eukprot:tig00000037_g10080.t1
MARELRAREEELRAARAGAGGAGREEAERLAGRAAELEGPSPRPAPTPPAPAGSSRAALEGFRGERAALEGRLRELEGRYREQEAGLAAAARARGLADPAADPADFPSVVEHARYLGMDPVFDAPYLWIAEQALNAPLPEGWSEHRDATGRPYYYNAATDASIWEHPLDDYFRFLFLQLRERAAGAPLAPPRPAGPADGAPAAPGAPARHPLRLGPGGRARGGARPQTSRDAPPGVPAAGVAQQPPRLVAARVSELGAATRGTGRGGGARGKSGAGLAGGGALLLLLGPLLVALLLLLVGLAGQGLLPGARPGGREGRPRAEALRGPP